MAKDEIAPDSTDARSSTVLAELQPLIAAVQRNCDIADARHAQSMTLCSYLLEMREYFRWEQGLPPPQAPPRNELGRWIAAREALWNELEEQDFAPLPLAGECFDPYASSEINRHLIDLGMVYGAGIGRFHRPQFFLGALQQRQSRDGVEILISGREYARDLSATPAALRQGTVFLRQDVVSRMLWEKVEAWDGQPKEGALRRALAPHGFDADPVAAIARMTETESETLILHELAEHQAGALLGREWEEMLAAISDRRAEILCRAVRDLLADCCFTLPTLLARRAYGSLHFWFVNFDGMRRALLPSLSQAYKLWCDDGRDDALAGQFARGAAHWQDVARRLLALSSQEDPPGEAQIAALADAQALAL